MTALSPLASLLAGIGLQTSSTHGRALPIGGHELESVDAATSQDTPAFPKVMEGLWANDERADRNPQGGDPPILAATEATTKFVNAPPLGGFDIQDPGGHQFFGSSPARVLTPLVPPLPMAKQDSSAPTPPATDQAVAAPKVRGLLELLIQPAASNPNREAWPGRATPPAATSAMTSLSKPSLAPVAEPDRGTQATPTVLPPVATMAPDSLPSAADIAQPAPKEAVPAQSQPTAKAAPSVAKATDNPERATSPRTVGTAARNPVQAIPLPGAEASATASSEVPSAFQSRTKPSVTGAGEVPLPPDPANVPEISDAEPAQAEPVEPTPATPDSSPLPTRLTTASNQHPAEPSGTSDPAPPQNLATPAPIGDTATKAADGKSEPGVEKTHPSQPVDDAGSARRQEEPASGPKAPRRFPSRVLVKKGWSADARPWQPAVRKTMPSPQPQMNRDMDSPQSAMSHVELPQGSDPVREDASRLTGQASSPTAMLAQIGNSASSSFGPMQSLQPGTPSPLYVPIASNALSVRQATESIHPPDAGKPRSSGLRIQSNEATASNPAPAFPSQPANNPVPQPATPEQAPRPAGVVDATEPFTRPAASPTEKTPPTRDVPQMPPDAPRDPHGPPPLASDARSTSSDPAANDTAGDRREVPELAFEGRLIPLTEDAARLPADRNPKANAVASPPVRLAGNAQQNAVAPVVASGEEPAQQRGGNPDSSGDRHDEAEKTPTERTRRQEVAVSSQGSDPQSSGARPAVPVHPAQFEGVARAVEPPRATETRPTSPHVLPESDPPKAPMGPRDIKLELNSGDHRVEVRLVDRGGEVHVAVRTPDTRLAGELRENLPTLSSRLEESGLRPEGWHTPATSEGRREQDLPAGGAPNSQGQPGQESRERQRDPEQQQPKAFEQQPNRKEKGNEFAWFMSPHHSEQ